jgi:hypothetical protein
MIAVLWSTIHHKEASPMAQQISALGIDIAKLVFHVVGMNNTRHAMFRKHLARRELLTFIAKLPPLRIGMEACGSAHDWARRFREHGYEVRLIAPQFVKVYVKSPKNDVRDAEAVCEAMNRPTMRFVPITQLEQQDLQALHWVRERLIKARTALRTATCRQCFQLHFTQMLASDHGLFLQHSPPEVYISNTIKPTAFRLPSIYASLT